MNTTTLTERYLAAATRQAPESQRDEFRRELIERIGDDVDAQLSAGTEPDEAEREALTALGDPGVLVANYFDRPQRLIGPAMYPMWKQLLRVLAKVVIPSVAIAFPLAQALAQKHLGEIITSTAFILIHVTVHLAFWTTLFFVVLDRAGGDQPVVEWTPDNLPEVSEPSSHQTAVDVIANFAFTAIFVFAIFGHRIFLPFSDASGSTIPLFQPDTWAWMQWYLVAVAVVAIAFWTALYRHRRWNYTFAGALGVLGVAFAAPVVWALWTDRLFNHEFLAQTDWNNWAELIAPGGVLAIVFSFLVVLVTAIWPLDGYIKARRANREAMKEAQLS